MFFCHCTENGGGKGVMGTLHHKYRGYLGGAQGSVFQKMCNIIFSSKKYNFIICGGRSFVEAWISNVIWFYLLVKI